MRRVVVTGIGMVSPLGLSVATTWPRLLEGKSGVGVITRFDVSDLPCKIAGMVNKTGEPPATPFEVFDPAAWLEHKEIKKVDYFIMLAIAAAEQAVADSGWKAETAEQQERTGVLIGSGIGGLQAIYDAAILLKERGPRRISPFFIPSALINLASGQVSIRHGFKGPNHAVVTACSTGAHAIGDAARLIAFDDADLMVAGGSEASVSRLGVAGFAAARALSTSFNNRPEAASRPWDKDRDGFV
ncbi:MAG TPA: beta-ketoacyl synthase N-terminal-like domain-containing protein, partial [Alphaproteobacteria bacterium]